MSSSLADSVSCVFWTWSHQQPCSSLSMNACGTNLAARRIMSQKPRFRARGDLIVSVIPPTDEALSPREVSCGSDLPCDHVNSVLDWTGGEAFPWLLINKTQEASYKTEVSGKSSPIKNTLKARDLITLKPALSCWGWGHFSFLRRVHHIVDFSLLQELFWGCVLDKVQVVNHKLSH